MILFKDFIIDIHCSVEKQRNKLFTHTQEKYIVMCIPIP